MNTEHPQTDNALRLPAGPETRSVEPFFITPNAEFFALTLRNGEATVAKRLPVAYRDDPWQRRQFLGECVFLKSLAHPRIAVPEPMRLSGEEIFQVFRPDRYATLSQLREVSAHLGKRLPVELAVFILEAIIDIVRHVEQQAARGGNEGPLDIVLHPDTVLVNPAGSVLLTSIGASNPPHITSSILGKDTRRYFVYAAPEQCVGGSPPDRRACYFTLGILCYELLTSQPLFSLPTVRDLDVVIRRKVRRLHPLVSDVDRELACADDLVSRLLEPVPGSRESDIDAIAGELSAITVSRRHGEHELAEFRRDLDQALSAANQPQRDEITGQLSAITDIDEYNAS